MKVFRLTTAVLLAVWMCVIFSFSAQNAETSSDTSAGVIEKIAGAVYPGYNEMTESEQKETVDSLQHVTRKTAHATIYAVLGVLSLLTFISYERLKRIARVGISATVCLLYAASDEFHQLFVAGRSCEFRDVMIDFSGAAVGIAFSFLIVLLISRRKSEKAGVKK